MSQTYIVFDVGHTRTKIGTFHLQGKDQLPECVMTRSIFNTEEIPWSDLKEWFRSPDLSLITLTGSNRNMIEELKNQWPEDVPPPHLLTSKSQIPIQVKVDAPEKVGADRLFNAVAARLFQESPSSMIIIDSGTAATVDAVSEDGTFLGGAILPGILMGVKALHELTTTLPLVDARQFLKKTPTAIGRNTEDAMSSGLFWGHLGAIREVVSRVQSELQGNPQLFLTGGALPILEPYFPEAICHPDLSLIGIVLTASQLSSSRDESSESAQ
ncbi:type III pantothenate kinase [Thalassoglobus sp. JC818]|uniref:type III pantothenate kinase n=1 Tax=Thalassoglobus sp. JC818 TaxID=3232136 RepID=UPI003457803F